jgi:ketosteroid isomerase-like protein
MTPIEATRAMYDLLARGEWASVADFMAEDFVIHEPATLPYGGEWRGRDALQRLFVHVMGFWDDPLVEWIDLVGGDDHAVALLRMTATVPGTGTRFTQRVAEVTRFTPDGKMAEMHIHYFDTGEMARMLAG